jgi:putative hydrolase of the HAD superfamily
MAFTAICLDFDGTLAHYQGDFEGWLNRLRLELALIACDLAAFREALSAALRREGPLRCESALREVLTHFELAPPPDLDVVVRDAVAAYATEVALLSGALEALEVCCARKIPLALVSNGPEDMQRAALRKVGLEGYFRAILISGDRDVAVRKPHPRIFGLACTGLESVPEKTLMIGDDLEADIAGAQAYGMQALLVGREAEGVESVSDTRALAAWLERKLGP